MSLSSLLKISENQRGLSQDLALLDLGYAVAGTSVTLSSGFVIMKESQRLMNRFGLEIHKSQTYFRLYEHLGTISNHLLRSVIKIFAVVYVILLVPIFEEWFFRDLIYQRQISSSEEENWNQRFFRVFSNGLLFGVFHFNWLQGWANIPIILVSTVAGIVFAFLRELTGNRWAATISHSLNNSIVLFVNFLKI